MTEEQNETNRKKAKVRARVEHVFGAQDVCGHWARTIGLLRAKVKIGMMNLVYNMMRLVQLLKRDASQNNSCPGTRMTGWMRPQ